MPGMYFGRPVNWAWWYRCRDVVAKQMIASGWNKHARKFHEVCMRQTRKMYAKGPSHV